MSDACVHGRVQAHEICSGKFMIIKLWISQTSNNKSRHRAFIVSKGKGKKYEQNPKVRSFQIKTNKMSEITGKGVGYTEGRCQHPKCPRYSQGALFVCICILYKVMFTNKQNGGMRKEFINYIFVFDKTFGLVPTYQHKNEGSKPRSS